MLMPLIVFKEGGGVMQGRIPGGGGRHRYSVVPFRKPTHKKQIVKKDMTHFP